MAANLACPTCGSPVRQPPAKPGPVTKLRTRHLGRGPYHCVMCSTSFHLHPRDPNEHLAYDPAWTWTLAAGAVVVLAGVVIALAWIARLTS